jgi:hypothetical protein
MVISFWSMTRGGGLQSLKAGGEMLGLGFGSARQGHCTTCIMKLQSQT